MEPSVAILPSSASVNFNFKLEAEIALVSIDPATHPPVKVYI